MAGGYTGHLAPRETRKGKHYQMVIEGPRDPVTGRRERSYETLRLPKREAEKVLHERLARLNRAAEGTESGKRLGEWLDECCYSMTRDEYFLEGAEDFAESGI